MSIGPQTPYRRKHLADIAYTDRVIAFCPKFYCHSNGGRSGENAIGSIQWPIPENPPIDAKISQIFLTQTKL